MNKKIRWAIVGTGGIAHKFAQALAILPDAELVAVSSRRKETANKFADEFNIPARYIGAQQLAQDKNIDVVYISTIHPAHKEETIICLNGGKAVLCEKPFAMNGLQIAEMIDCAKKNNLFLMEAMWMYFFPAMEKIRTLIAEGAIGAIRLLQADFCINPQRDPMDRMLNPLLGGGSLLDIGVYDIAFAQMVFGKEPHRIASLAHIISTGVDEQASMILSYNDGAMASLNCAFCVETASQAVIYGTNGYIKIPYMFFRPDSFFIKIGSDSEKEMKFTRLGNGYTYEAMEVIRCLRSGQTESPTMPLKTSAAIMRTMDIIRSQWKLVYPME